MPEPVAATRLSSWARAHGNRRCSGESRWHDSTLPRSQPPCNHKTPQQDVANRIRKRMLHWRSRRQKPRRHGHDASCSCHCGRHLESAAPPRAAAAGSGQQPRRCAQRDQAARPRNQKLATNGFQSGSFDIDLPVLIVIVVTLGRRQMRHRYCGTAFFLLPALRDCHRNEGFREALSFLSPGRVGRAVQVPAERRLPREQVAF